MKLIQHLYKPFKDVGMVTFSSVFNTCLNLLVTVVLSRSLTKDEFALIPFLLTIQSAMVVFSYPGLSSIIQKAMITGAFDFHRYAIIRTFKRSVSVSGILLIFIYLFGDLVTNNQNTNILYLAALVAPFAAIDFTEQALLGLSEFKTVCIYRMSSGLLNVFITSVCLWVTDNIFLIILFSVCSLRILQSLGGYYLVSRKLTGRDNHIPSQSDKLWGDGTSLSYLAVFGIILGSLQNFFLYQVSPAGLSNYYLGAKFPDNIKDLLKLMTSAPLQKVLRDEEARSPKSFQRLIKKVFLILVPPCILFAISSKFIIPTVFGIKYQEAFPVSSLLFLAVPGVICNHLILQREIIFEGTKFYTKLIYTSTACNFLAILVLVNYLGGFGFAMGVFLSTYLTFLIILIHLKNLISQKAY